MGEAGRASPRSAQFTAIIVNRFDQGLRRRSNAAMNLETLISDHASAEGALLPLLHDVQARFGCISPEAEAQIAKALNLSRAEVHGVVSFYHDFTSAPDPRPSIELCRAEACQARGVAALADAAVAEAGNRINVKAVYCLGLCSSGPAARVGGRLYARLDHARLLNLVRSL